MRHCKQNRSKDQISLWKSIIFDTKQASNKASEILFPFWFEDKLTECFCCIRNNVRSVLNASVCIIYKVILVEYQIINRLHVWNFSLVQIFSRIWTEYGDLESKSPNSLRIWRNLKDMKLVVRTYFTLCSVSIIPLLSSNNIQQRSLLYLLLKHRDVYKMYIYYIVEDVYKDILKYFSFFSAHDILFTLKFLTQDMKGVLYSFFLQ